MSVDITQQLPAASASTPTRLHAEAPVVQVAIPLGVVEASLAPHVRLTGDLLVSTAAIGLVEAAADAAIASGESLGSRGVLAPLEGMPMDGARAPDILAVIQRALENQ